MPQAEETPVAAAYRRTRSALVRTRIELGRLEIRDEDYNAAIGQYEEALRVCSEIYGEDAAETGACLFSMPRICKIRSWHAAHWWVGPSQVRPPHLSFYNMHNYLSKCTFPVPIHQLILPKHIP